MGMAGAHWPSTTPQLLEYVILDSVAKFGGCRLRVFEFRQERLVPVAVEAVLTVRFSEVNSDPRCDFRGSGHVCPYPLKCQVVCGLYFFETHS